MSRSLKKGPFIDPKLEAKVVAQAEGNKKSVIKTWSRASMISPDFVGQTIAVHNGNKFIPVYVTENMVGHKLGEFVTYHILSYIYWNKLVSVVYGDRLTYEIRRNHTCA